ncbi:MAG: hypothetical protein IK032_01650 [Bacteroidales bacterium]|nr:hypothetical protein [Bacteroidales bacterium]MBR5029428.1 hypothetical protein [Bacteroidales bacterium]
MSLILGKEYCKIDSNGRFKFPVALKKQLQPEDDGRFFIRQSIYAECLELWTYASFYAEVERLKKNLNPYKPEDRFLLRKLTNGNIIELDTNDRLLIPTEQKSKIGDTKDIVLISLGGNFIEIWDYNKYNQMESTYSDEQFVALASEKLGNMLENIKVE